jgi:hypothetical protein
MSLEAVSLITYVWHYLVARVIYDQLVRPLAHGDAPRLVLLACIAALSFALGRRSSALGRRSWRRT